MTCCRTRNGWRLACGLVLALTGCSSEEYSYVSGRVTLDGQPVENAFVTFVPEPNTDATLAYGRTDHDGHYTMALTDAHDGILPGTYRVEISTADQTTDDTGRIVNIPERIPLKYNQRTELTGKKVQAGESQTMDFALVSDGRVVQPTPPRP